LPEVDTVAMTHQHLLRSMDALMTHQDAVDDVVARLLRPLIDQDLSLVFYDLTTIRAAGLSDQGDDVRKYGMAKEGVIARQFMLGVVQTAEGLPIYHEVFDGNQAEAPTLLPTLKTVLARFAQIKRLIVVADRGLLSLDNMDELAKVKLPSGQALEDRKARSHAPHPSRVRRDNRKTITCYASKMFLLCSLCRWRGASVRRAPAGHAVGGGDGGLVCAVGSGRAVGGGNRALNAVGAGRANAAVGLGLARGGAAEGSCSARGGGRAADGAVGAGRAGGAVSLGGGPGGRAVGPGGALDGHHGAGRAVVAVGAGQAV
jgi:hypothetical protein